MCKQIDDDFLKVARFANLKAGSTLILSLLHNGKFTLSSIGDSVGILLHKNGQSQKLTCDQTPSRPDEYNRIIKNNGFVSTKNDVARVDGNLAVSRAIGDI